MRKDIYQTWKNDGLVQSKLKLIKELASRSCGMGVIASQLEKYFFHIKNLNFTDVEIVGQVISMSNKM